LGYSNYKSDKCVNDSSGYRPLRLRPEQYERIACYPDSNRDAQRIKLIVQLVTICDQINKKMQIIKSIQSRIYQIRNERVMLDYDLAFLYEVETKVLNQSVKHNSKRFPEDFIFRLSNDEWDRMRSQFVTASESDNSSSQFVMMNQGKRNTNITPYAFTEQGVAMLSGILKSDKAINMNIAIM